MNVRIESRIQKIICSALLAAGALTPAFSVAQDRGQEARRGSDPYASGRYIDPADGAYAEPRSYSSAQRWCRNLSEELTHAQWLAVMQYTGGHYERAAQILTDELARASNDPGFQDRPMVGRALRRGIALAQIVNQTEGQGPAGARVLSHFLNAYFSFLRDVADNLDVPYFIPVEDCGERCGNGSDLIDGYERRFLQMIKAEVDVVLDSMVVNGGDTGYPEVPVGNGESFLSLLEKSIHFALRDIQSSPYANVYACSSRRLDDLLDDLNSGGVGGPGDTVNYAYSVAKRDIAPIGEQACER